METLSSKETFNKPFDIQLLRHEKAQKQINRKRKIVGSPGFSILNIPNLKRAVKQMVLKQRLTLYFLINFCSHFSNLKEPLEPLPFLRN